MIPALPTPILEVYYTPACAPCRLELPAMVEFARHDGAHVRIVIIDEEAQARTDIYRLSPALAAGAVVKTQAAPQSTLRAAGDGDGILPYARSLTTDGKVCAKWRGILTVARARALVASCTRMITSPPSHRS